MTNIAMDKKTKFILVFLGSGAAMFLIFYLYPAKIFDVWYEGSIAQSEEQVSLKEFLGWDNELKTALAEQGITLKQKLSGWMILMIILIGMPAMFAYRSLVSRKVEEEKEN